MQRLFIKLNSRFAFDIVKFYRFKVMPLIISIKLYFIKYLTQKINNKSNFS